jgi:beta-glucosidase
MEFPKGFLWGSATSAHQVEGNNVNSDWWAWERSEERKKALRQEGKESSEFVSGDACDHYHRFEEDFDLAKSGGQNAHRFSIEWARIEPAMGEWNEREIAHYREVLQALRQRGIKAFVTLLHFTNPVWFSERGGWLT